MPHRARDQGIRQLAAETLRRGRPLEIHVASGSMRPLLQPGARLRIEPLQRPPQLGEVVLFDLGGGAIVHRVIGLDDHGVRTKGDALHQPDPPVPRAALLGRLVAVDHHPIDTPAWRVVNRQLARLSPHSRLLWTPLRLAGRLRRALGLHWL